MPLVPPDSPLFRVPSTLDRRAVLFLDGIRYSMHMFDTASSRFAQTLIRLSGEEYPPGHLAQNIADAMSDAWLLVDIVHRLRELLQQAPRLKRNSPPLQLFLRRTTSVENLRHFVQHFRSGIDTYIATQQPLWGTLSSIRDNTETGVPESITIAPGTFFEHALVPMCTFDSERGRFVERVRLQAGKLVIDLATLLEQVTEFGAWYTEWFKATFPGETHYGADLRARFVVTRATAAPVSKPPASAP